MSKNNKSVKMLLPGLGIVFGSGIGLLASILCSFHMAVGIIGGAAVGLLVCIIVLMLYGKESGEKGRV
jgi:hypothetical protein